MEETAEDREEPEARRAAAVENAEENSWWFCVGWPRFCVGWPRWFCACRMGWSGGQPPPPPGRSRKGSRKGPPREGRPRAPMAPTAPIGAAPGYGMGWRRCSGSRTNGSKGDGKNIGGAGDAKRDWSDWEELEPLTCEALEPLTWELEPLAWEAAEALTRECAECEECEHDAKEECEGNDAERHSDSGDDEQSIAAPSGALGWGLRVRG